MRDFLAGTGVKAWLVGGTVRDLLLGREPLDIDLATEAPPEQAARGFADSIGGSFFTLSEEFKACRVISADRRLTYDFSQLRAATIEEDLHLRDFTMNSIAATLPECETVDPLGGTGDIDARLLRETGPAIFEDDPLRLLRAVRLEQETGFTIADSLAGLIRRNAVLASNPAAERIFSELSSLLEAPGAAAAIRRLDDLCLLEVLLPEVHALKGIVQNEYHHLDVYDHALAVADGLDRIIAEPEAYFPTRAATLKPRFETRVTGNASWRTVMSLAAILHDVAKPNCAFTDEAGDIRFFEHDRLGAEMAEHILSRLKAGTETTGTVTYLVRRHMRFEALKQAYPPSPRVRLRYIRATEPFAPEAIILSVADQLAVRGPKTTEAAVRLHIELADALMDEYFTAQEAEPLPKLTDGDELMRELDLEPGPVLGRLLDRIHVEQQLGNIDSREQALELAARILEEEKEAESA